MLFLHLRKVINGNFSNWKTETLINWVLDIELHDIRNQIKPPTPGIYTSLLENNTDLWHGILEWSIWQCLLSKQLFTTRQISTKSFVILGLGKDGYCLIPMHEGWEGQPNILLIRNFWWTSSWPLSSWNTHLRKLAIRKSFSASLRYKSTTQECLSWGLWNIIMEKDKDPFLSASWGE